MNNVMQWEKSQKVQQQNPCVTCNEKDYLKRTSKPSHMSHKICDNGLAAISKSKTALMLNNLVYIGM